MDFAGLQGNHQNQGLFGGAKLILQVFTGESSKPGFLRWCEMDFCRCLQGNHQNQGFLGGAKWILQVFTGESSEPGFLRSCEMGFAGVYRGIIRTRVS